MKRLLIFLFLFPAIATAVFYAVIYILSGARPESRRGTGAAYRARTIPALVFASVDWLIAKTRVPGDIGTTLVVYGIAVLAAALLFGHGLGKETWMLGLVGGIPAAVCSWLSQKNQGFAVTR